MAKQTEVMHEQFVEMREEQERPRVAELIQRVLTPLIRILSENKYRIERREQLPSLIDWLEEGFSTVASLAYRDFRTQFPDIVGRMKLYDEKCTKAFQQTGSDLSQELLELSKNLREELEGLRGQLGKQYNIAREEYFPREGTTKLGAILAYFGLVLTGSVMVRPPGFEPGFPADSSRMGSRCHRPGCPSIPSVEGRHWTTAARSQPARYYF